MQSIIRVKGVNTKVNNRILRILDLLLQSPNLSIQALMAQTNYTRRQIDYSIKQFNILLEERNLGPIVYHRKYRFQIPNATQHYISEEIKAQCKALYPFENKELRHLALAVYLFCGETYISMDHLTSLLKVSKNTVMSDLRVIEEQLESKGVKVQYSRENGFHLIGPELTIRSTILRQIPLVRSELERTNFLEIVLGSSATDNTLSKQLKELSHYLVIKMDDYGLNHIDYKLADVALMILLVSIRYQKLGKTIESIQETPFILNQNIATMIEHYHGQEFHHFSVEEKMYCAILLQSTLLASLQVKKNDETLALLRAFSDSIVRQFSFITQFPLSSTLPLSNNIYLHLQCAYFRLVHKIPIVNPLLDEITNRYPELTAIIGILLHPLEKLVKCKIPADEIGYIVIHLAALIPADDVSQITRRRALIICPNGIGSSGLLESQLQSLFPEIIFERKDSSRCIEEIAGNYDLIFSSISLKEKISTPVFIVPIVLSPNIRISLTQDVYRVVFGLRPNQLLIDQVLSAVEMQAEIKDRDALENALSQIFASETQYDSRKEGAPMLEDLLTTNNVQVKDAVGDWREAIRYAASPLLDQNYITEEYIDAMIDSVVTYGPYIVIMKDIAIPHAKSEHGVNQLAMSFLRLEKPVYILDDKEKEVRIMFVLATKDSESHLKALAQLSRVLLDDKANEQLFTVNNAAELIEIVGPFGEGKEAK